MAKKSRTKGRQGELEWAKYVEGERTSQTGLASPDVTAGPRYGGHRFEVKRRAKSFTTLYDAYYQARWFGAAVAFRDDRQPWMVTIEADRYLEMVEALAKQGWKF